MTEFRTGNGADWLDFLSTELGRYRSVRVELLTDPAALRAWLAEHDLEPVAAITPDDVHAARELREALHRVTTATLRDEQPARADRRVVQQALAADQPLRLRSSGPLRLERPANASVALGRLARQAVADLTGPNLVRLHACGDDTCSAIYLDHTGRRRWCSDERCGVRLRVRAHRARQRETDGSSAR
jgi:predicted RNA-binding Zn ribbon-like protein